MQLQGTFGSLGFGNMGSAIVRGLIDKGLVPASMIFVYDVDAQRMAEAESIGLRTADSPGALAASCGMLMLAVKPQQFDEAAAAIGPEMPPETLVISIMAGISTSYIQAQTGPERKVVRVMPNLASQVHAGAAAIAGSPNCSDEDVQTAVLLFEAVGAAEVVPESNMDAITALIGSGPAYFFNLADCMARTAAELGLSADQAERLAAQTLFGAGQLMRASGETAAHLRDRVASKGGTTAEALAAFQEHKFAEAVRYGMAAARDRSRELGK